MAQNRQYADKAVGDATRGRILAVRAAGGCARLKTYRACGLRALEKSDLDASALVREHVILEGDFDEEIEVEDCKQHPDGRGLIRMSNSVLMMVAKTSCILQSEDDGEKFQVHFEAKQENMTWLSGEDQVEFRSEVIIVHFMQKLHVVMETGKQGVNVLYDEGPVKQVTLTDDGRAGVRLREEEQEAPSVTVEQAKQRKAMVSLVRDEVNALLPSAKEAITIAEATAERAKLAHEAAKEKDKAFRDARAKISSKDDTGTIDVALECGSLAQVNSNRVELVQLPAEKFDSAQLQFDEEGGWTWACNGGLVVTRADGNAVVKLTDNESSKVNKDLSNKVARVQLMESGDRIVPFEDASRFQLMKDGLISFIRDPSVFVLDKGFCTFAGDGMRSKLEDEGDLIHEEDSGLSWALRDAELVMLSSGHAAISPEKSTAEKEQVHKPQQKKKETPKVDSGKNGLVEDAASEEPLASAAVYARQLTTSNSSFSVQCTTDDDGRFDLQLSEDVVVRAEKVGYASEIVRVSAKSLAVCLRLWPLSVSHTFMSSDGITLKHEGCCTRLPPDSAMLLDGSAYAGSARLDVSLPSAKDGLSIFVGISEDDKEKDSALRGEVHVSLQTAATVRDGAPFPVVWTLDGDAVRECLPTRKRKSFVFRSVIDLPGIYIDLGTTASICMETQVAVIRLLQRHYQTKSAGKNLLDQPRVYVAHTAIKMMINGIVEVDHDELPKVNPLLLEEAKKEGPLQAALEKCRISIMKETRIETTYEKVVDWVSSCIYIDGVELPLVDEAALMSAHAEVNVVRALTEVTAKLSGARGLSAEAEAASKMKTLPGALKDLAPACLSLFADAKKTADQIGGFNYFQKELKKGLLGRCSNLSPYEVPEKVLNRTQSLAKYDDAVLQKDYPAAALLGAWLREFLSCALALHDMGVAVKNKKMGNQVERRFLDVASPVPALAALRAPPKDDVRTVEFVAPGPGWWNVDFDSWRAAGGGSAAAKALA